MINIPNYRINAIIYEGNKSHLYRGYREGDNMPVVLKTLATNNPSFDQITRFKQEYEITCNIKHFAGVINTYALETDNQSYWAIILEDFGGESLEKLKIAGNLMLADFLKLALKIIEIIEQLHQQQLIHKDINPSNILMNQHTGQVKLIDFGISTAFSQEIPIIRNTNVLEGTLAYLSPEQTGRMNRIIDYRTDFYSFGITLYELLIGQQPFQATETLELIHSHIAKQVVPPHHIKPDVPIAVSNIIMKLLEKDAENRYQSAFGIKHDLKICLEQWQSSGRIIPFKPAQQDIPHRFQISSKLYGREKEIARLLLAFERISQGTSTELMLITGQSGIGKTALVQELYKPLTQKSGYFITGKFDKYQSNIPYFAFITAFSDLIRQILGESEEQLAQWKQALLTALGQQAAIVVDFVPELELIIGVPPTLPKNSPKNFNEVFQQFIKVFYQKSHPLVIFLDNLQWADSASLNLIKLLRGNPDERYLFLIGTYLNTEIENDHPLLILLNQLRQSGVVVNQINLSPLNIKQINYLLGDSLHSNIHQIQPLAELVMRKTEGNPFFVKEFLKTLYQEKLLTFQVVEGENVGQWQWDTAQIEAMGITDNVVELMIARLKKLPKSAQQILCLAACIGNQFDINNLTLLYEKPVEVTLQDLLPALQHGLIYPTNTHKTEKKSLAQHYKFSHARVKQAAYALIDETEKQTLHLKIGRLLLQHTKTITQEDKLFDIVNHLNYGQQFITTNQERIELAKLNLVAGKKASAAAAHTSALTYLSTGMALLDENSWQQEYQLTYNLYKERASVEYLNGYFEKAETLLHQAEQQAKSILEKSTFYNKLIVQYTVQAKYRDAIQIGLKALNLLGVNLPQKEIKTVIQTELAEIEQKLSLLSLQELIYLPNIEADENKMVIQLLTNMQSVTYFFNKDLWALTVVKAVNLLLQQGNTPQSPINYANYGLLRSALHQQPEFGYQLGLIGLEISRKQNFLSQKCKVCFVVTHFLMPWVKPLREVDALNEEGYQAGMECGQLQYVAYILMHKMINLFYRGNGLTHLSIELPIFQTFCQRTKNQLALDVLLGSELNLSYLTGLTDEFSQETEKQYLQKCRFHQSDIALCIYHIFKAQSLYLYEQPELALTCLMVANQYLATVSNTILIPAYNFYHSLVLIELYPKATQKEQETYWNQLKNNQQQMKLWSDNCIANFGHHYQLVAAEMARLSQQDLLAMDLYDQAIELARKYEFNHIKALGYELATKFWLSKGKQEFAQLYLKKAHHGYKLWGAKRKVKLLEERYPQLLAKKFNVIHQRDTPFTVINTSTHTPSSILDLATVIKVSQTISGEIVLERLLEKLMKIVVENAGAQIGSLILEKSGKWFIEAESVVENNFVAVLQSIPLENADPHRISINLINYVTRTQEPIVLHDASQTEYFNRDPHLTKRQVKSILCVPLINQGKLIGILYLENNLTTGAFTPERLIMLKMLSSQMAISINNANLYTALRESEERFRIIAETTPVPIVISRITDGSILYANTQFIETMQVPRKIELTQYYTVDFYYDMAEREEMLVQFKRDGYVHNYEMTAKKFDNTLFSIVLFVQPIVFHDESVIVSTFFDITERKRAEEERLNFTAELKALNQAYGRFVPSEFLSFLGKKSVIDVQLGDQVGKEMTILFSDIRGFTLLSESMEPQEIFDFINAYLGQMEPIITENHGFIDKYIGDAIMALFPTSADDALRGAITMLKTLYEYNNILKTAGYSPIRIGIGLNTGPLILGTVGGQNRMDSTVISDAVNLASRTEGLTKVYGTSLLITEYTYHKLKNVSEYKIRVIDRVKVKGKSSLVTIYEVFEHDPENIILLKMSTRAHFEQGFEYYHQGYFVKAQLFFNKVLAINEQDEVAQVYLTRCKWKS